MKRSVIFVGLVLALLVAAPTNAAQLTNPFPAGNCTAAVWQIWVGWLGHSNVPSLRSAKYWYSDGIKAGYSHSAAPPPLFSIMVLDGWTTNPLGHVAVVLYEEPVTSWGPDWSFAYTAQLNWLPHTDGDATAPLQFYWVAVNSRTGTCWYWYPNTSSWGSGYPLLGFVWD